MQLDGDGWWMRVGFLRRTMIAARMMKPLPYWWCIILVCRREFGGPWIDALFTRNARSQRSSFLCGNRAPARFQRIVLFVAMAKLCSMFPLISARGTRVSSYHGRERCNDFSIGIELEGTDTLAIPMRSTSSWWR